MIPADLLTLIGKYSALVHELKVVYYLQDSEKIDRLQAKIDEIEDALIDWTVDGPLLKKAR